MSRMLWLTVLLGFTTLLQAEGLRLADPAVIERLRHLDRPVAPVWVDRPARGPEVIDWTGLMRAAPDVDYLRTFAEYELNQGILMRWRPGNFNAELASMIVPITTGESRAIVYLVVRPESSDAAHATNWLTTAGADMDRVVFIEAPNNSVWIRDYGPRFVSADFTRVIIDHTYEGASSRPLDNQVPWHVAQFLEKDLHDIGLVHGGGNYHQFATGRGFATDSILDRNPGMSEQQVRDLFALYQGADLTLLGSLPQTFDGTQHLDMWFLPVDDQTVVIGDYTSPPPGTSPIPPEVVAVTEATADYMAHEGFKVLRVPGWRIPNPQPWSTHTHVTYTNSVIVNDLVITCEYPGYEAQNAEVIAVLEKAFADRTVIAVDCSNIIHSSGALHCIVKHKPFSERFGSRPPYYGFGR